MVKNLLLLSCFALTAITGYSANRPMMRSAKRAPKHVKFETKASPLNVSAKDCKAVLDAQATSEKKSAIRKTAPSGMYYEAPEGSYLEGFSFDGHGWFGTRFLVPPFKNVCFKYHINKPETDTIAWKLNMPDENYYEDISAADIRKDSVLNFGMYDGPMAPDDYWATPTMCYNKDSFLLGTDNYYYENGYQFTTPKFAHNAELSAMTNYNDHNNKNKHYYGWGVIDRRYLFGSGNDEIRILDEATGDSVDVSCPVVAIRQKMGKTNGPLYIEYVFCSVLSFSDNPIPEDKTLSMTLYNPTTNDVYATLTCSADEVYPDDDYQTEYGVLHAFQAKFYNLKENEIGDVYIEPVIVDGEWAISIDGLDQEGVDFAMFGINNTNNETGVCEYPIPYAEFILAMPNGDTQAMHYTSDYLSVQFSFEARYDGVEVMADNNLNVLNVSADGETCSNPSYIESYGEDLGGAVVKTATSWFGFDYVYDEELEYDKRVTLLDGEYGYYYPNEELPEWITAIYCDASAWDTYRSNLLFVECEPLPEGVEYRTAKFYIEGDGGVISEDPIIIIQGDMNASGVSQIVKDIKMQSAKKIYNLAGQLVDKSYKGIVIKNGVKAIQK